MSAKIFNFAEEKAKRTFIGADFGNGDMSIMFISIDQVEQLPIPGEVLEKILKGISAEIHGKKMYEEDD